MNRQNPHTASASLYERYRTGALNRREFVRIAALLGASTGLVPGVIAANRPRKGGTLRVSMNVKEITDPAVFDWQEKGNIARQMLEPLTEIGADNVVRPKLAERWAPSEDLRTWTFHLRKGVTWSNGDPFIAEDVIFNVRRWLDPATGSSNLGRFAAMTELVATGRSGPDGSPVLSRRMAPGAIEAIDDHTVRFHLKMPDIALPEAFADYPALIVHRDFEKTGGNLIEAPVGTGPFTLTRYRVGSTAVMERRTDAAYWGGEVSLDRIVFIDHGDDPAAQLAALASDQVDLNYETNIDQVDAVAFIPHLKLIETPSAQTGVARMKVTGYPFDNADLRKAIQLCVDHDRLLELAYRGRGLVAADHHVAAVHPAYAAVPPLKRDYAGARSHLAKAGYENGISLSIDCVSNPTWEQNVCKALSEMVRPIGIELSINVMPGATYWDRWQTTPFGFTAWAHRPLATQVLNLAYRTGAPWNETDYANPDYDALLDEAGAIVEPDARRPVMARLERMLQEDGIIVQALWRNVFVTANKRVHGYRAHPALEMHFEGTWLA